MDEYVIVNKSDLTSMADTIRDALGSTDNIAVGDLTSKLIESIQTGGGGGFETGTFCPAEFISLRRNNYTVTHTQNKIPQYIIVYMDESFENTQARTANQLYFCLASPRRCLCFIQEPNTSYSSSISQATDQDWTKSPDTYGFARISIGEVDENGFALGSPVLSVGLAPVNYRWMVIG